MFFDKVGDIGDGGAQVVVEVAGAVVDADEMVVVEPPEFEDIELVGSFLGISEVELVFGVHAIVGNVEVDVVGSVD